MPDESLKETFFVPRKTKGRLVYGIVIVLLIIGGAFLQFHWMQSAREAARSGEIISNPVAEWIGRWMLEKRGLGAGPGGMPIAPGVERVDCPACLGTGKTPAVGGAPGICAICQGVGFRMIRRFEAAEKLCPLCAGMGRVERPDTGQLDTCPRCGGRGLVQTGISAADNPAVSP